MRRFLFDWPDIKGRAPIKEYWIGVCIALVALIVSTVIVIICSKLCVEHSENTTSLTESIWLIIGILYVVLLLDIWFSYLALSIRRLHDAGLSGVQVPVLMLITFVVPILWVVVLIMPGILPSVREKNQYGYWDGEININERY